jgi:hypothetical protein
MDRACGHDRAAGEWSVWVNMAAPWKADHGTGILLRGEWDPRALPSLGHAQVHEQEQSALTRAGGSSSSAIVLCTGDEGALGIGPRTRACGIPYWHYCCTLFSGGHYCTYVPHGTRAQSWMQARNQLICPSQCPYARL